MLHDFTPGIEEMLEKQKVSVYLGIDPTADSLHIGHLASIMLLKQFQIEGHKPLLILGGATGMIGDPSGKSQERNLLDLTTIKANADAIHKQLTKLLDFSGSAAAAELLNNHDWVGKMSFLEFIRDIGKHITISYMMSKDSVKKRLDTGLSFTEFTYQLVQGYDFYYLYENKNCRIQIGGADQWGNITTGTELIRRKCQGEAHALTCPLITKADGGKFGKTEEGNVWLNPDYTSPYKFYQFWLNVSDEEAKRYLYVFTTISTEEIIQLIAEHDAAPHLRILQKRLALEVTCMIHSPAEYEKAVSASDILFGKGTIENLTAIDEKTFLQIFDGVPVFELEWNEVNGSLLADILCTKTNIIESKAEFKRAISGGAISINKQKLNLLDATIIAADLLNKKYILVQKGKKQFYLIKINNFV